MSGKRKKHDGRVRTPQEEGEGEKRSETGQAQSRGSQDEDDKGNT